MVPLARLYFFRQPCCFLGSCAWPSGFDICLPLTQDSPSFLCFHPPRATNTSSSCTSSTSITPSHELTQFWFICDTINFSFEVLALLVNHTFQHRRSLLRAVRTAHVIIIIPNIRLAVQLSSASVLSPSGIKAESLVRLPWSSLPDQASKQPDTYEPDCRESKHSLLCLSPDLSFHSLHEWSLVTPT